MQACGTGALFSSMTYLQTGYVERIYVACSLIFAGLVFDILDGRIARWRQKTSAMGRELDSLADVISFGVAPAVLAYACGMQGLYDRLILVFFVACGVSRLARYNVTADKLSEGTGKVKYFEGTPIPTSIVLVGLLTFAASQNAIGFEPLVRRLEHRGPHSASLGAAVSAVWHAHDQPYSNTKTLACSRPAAANPSLQIKKGLARRVPTLK
jgi:CDP-diacylglycerol--serine O-phosphatidyltransferase